MQVNDSLPQQIHRDRPTELPPPLLLHAAAATRNGGGAGCRQSQLIDPCEMLTESPVKCEAAGSSALIFTHCSASSFVITLLQKTCRVAARQR